MSIYNGRILSFRAGKYFDIIEELIPKKEYGSKEDMPIKYTLSKSGEYIGDIKTADRLVKKYGVEHFEAPNCKVVCIGYCPSKKKWYGWSHRAIFGFGLGAVVKKGDCCNSSGLVDSYLKEHPEEDKSLPIGFTAKTSADAKKMAIAFAESVS